MTVIIKKFNIIIVLILTIAIIPSVAFCGNSSKEKVIKELTRTFQSDGWYDLSFGILGQDTVSIRHAGAKQNDKLTEGQMVSAIGSVLTPDVVSKLKKSGFKKGIFIDGKGREYPVELSEKYYNEQQNFHKKLSGGE